jgi:enamine deaminase RidA (YjgF/YER057c/UK114 family)
MTCPPVGGEWPLVAGRSLEHAVEDVIEAVLAPEFILGSRASAGEEVVPGRDFAGMNEEWDRWFATNPPARQGARLPISPKGMRISIATIAVS